LILGPEWREASRVARETRDSTPATRQTGRREDESMEIVTVGEIERRYPDEYNFVWIRAPIPSSSG
jgi:hypothetical protein